MAHETYEHPEPRGPREHGHDDRCEYTNNLGESCECDKDPSNQWGQAGRYQLLHTMKLMGWKPDNGSRPGGSWHRQYGPHHISLTRVKSGWSLRWDKQGGMTFLERGGFATITEAVEYFWGWTAERVDWSNKISWEHGAMTVQLNKAGIDPRRLGVKPTPIGPAVPGPLKHEVVDIMDQKGRDGILEKE